MRLFIAINFDDNTVNSLISLQEKLKASGAQGRFTRSENLHLTLAFIGEYNDPDKVMKVIREIR